MTRGQPVRWTALALVAAVTALVSTVVWMAVTATGALVPAAPWVSLAVLVALSLGVLVLAWPVRAYVRGDRTKPLDRLRAARVLVLAQAAALTGAAAVGWHLGQLAVLLRDIDLLANRGPAVRVGVAVLCSALLVAAGLLAQHWCRVPNRPEDDQPGEGTAAA